MAFEKLFLDQGDEVAKTLVRVVTDVLLQRPDADPDSAIAAATHVGQVANIRKVDDLYWYTHKSVMRKLNTDRRKLSAMLPFMASIEDRGIDVSDGSWSATELGIVVEEWLAGLNDLDRQVCLLRHKGFSHADVAAALGISVPNCWFRSHRAKMTLKRLLMARSVND